MDSKIEPVAWTPREDAVLVVAKRLAEHITGSQPSEADAQKAALFLWRCIAEGALSPLFAGRDVPAAALLAAEQRGRESERMQWYSDGSTPGIPLGTERNFIVAIRRARNGKIYSFPALYLNAFPLDFEDSEEWEKPTTGWFSAEANDDGDGSRYSQLHFDPGDEFLAWCEVPQFAAAIRKGE